MQTPYEILQHKQKQRKKVINQSQRKRSFSIRYNKNGQNATQYYIQKQKRLHNIKTQKAQSQPEKPKTTEQKYQIIFRQSIRKVNAYRTKVYHNHNALKNQKIASRFLTIGQNNSPRQQNNFIMKKKQNLVHKILENRIKTSNPEEKVQTLSVGKYKIILLPNHQKGFFTEVIPQILVEKCKINPNVNQNKQRIEKAIQSLYLHNKNMQTSARKQSIDSYFTQRLNHSSQEYQRFDKNLFSTIKQQRQQNFKLKSPRSTSEIKSKIKYLQEIQDEIKIHSSIPKRIDDLSITNFIKSKKKKRLPISLLRPKTKQTEQQQYGRSITHDIDTTQQYKFLKEIKQRYFSPNKKSRQATKIKFNSIEQNISGWQFQPFQNNYNINQQNNAKNRLLMED